MSQTQMNHFQRYRRSMMDVIERGREWASRYQHLWLFLSLIPSPLFVPLNTHHIETLLLLSSLLPPPTFPLPLQDGFFPIPASPKPSYEPNIENVAADPSNYGNREPVDVYGQPVDYDRLVVLHETVGSADSAINLFQTYHPYDQDQVSYHALIRRNGTVVYIVPEGLRAFGAGNSEFVTPDGRVETVQTNPDLASSVNNFAYHISLESPPDGYGYGLVHSGYTQPQYQSLAWLIDQQGVPETRITTHKAVDRSGERSDPRSFDRDQMLGLLRTYHTGSGLLSLERSIDAP